MSVGKVYLVGGGPGDPGLLTLKGARCLAEADLVLYDGLVNPLLLRHSHANAVRTCRVDSPGGRHLNQEEINRQLIEEARAGKTVVRLKGGDPFVFGRGSEEAAALAAAGIPYEVVPGITAATACAAYAGISLTHRDYASAVGFVTGHESPAKHETALPFNDLAKFPGTLVFYMGLHRLDVISRMLVECGKSSETPVAVICRGTTATQQTVVGNLVDIHQKVQQAGLRPPSLIIVGECVKIREQVQWFESKPLFGVSIGITTPEHQADAPLQRVIDLGGQPVLMPTIQLSPVDDWTEVDELIDTLKEVDWLIFTSVNGVDGFLGRLFEQGQDARALSRTKIAVIGESTAKRLRTYSIRADLVPNIFRAEALAEALQQHVSGKRVVWVRANRGRDVLPTELQQAGAHYSDVVVYRHDDVSSYPESVMEMIQAGRLNWVALSSPAIALQVAELVPASLHKGLRFAAISPVTEAAAQGAGLEISVVAQTHTWDGLLAAIVQSEADSR